MIRVKYILCLNKNKEFFYEEKDSTRLNSGKQMDFYRLTHIDTFRTNTLAWMSYPASYEVIGTDINDNHKSFGRMSCYLDQKLDHYPSMDITWESGPNNMSIPKGELGINHYISYEHIDVKKYIDKFYNDYSHYPSMIELSHPDMNFMINAVGKTYEYHGEYLTSQQHYERFGWTINKKGYVSGFAYKYDAPNNFTKIRLSYYDNSVEHEIAIGISQPLPSKYRSNLASISINQLYDKAFMIGDARFMGGSKYIGISNEDNPIDYRIDNTVLEEKFTITKGRIPFRLMNATANNNDNITLLFEFDGRIYECYIPSNLYLNARASEHNGEVTYDQYIYTSELLISSDMKFHITTNNGYIYQRTNDRVYYYDLLKNQGYDEVGINIYNTFK